MEIDANDLFRSRIIETCLPLYKGEHYQHAALESMKQVEMALREKAIAPKNLFGVHLVKWVLERGEHITLIVPLGNDFQEKAHTLFKGAFGYYRNYAAHDGAKIDKKVCLRIMVLSSELLDLIAASNRSFEGIGGVSGIIKAGIFKNFQQFRDFLNFLGRQQFIEDDYSEYELELSARGFNKIQEQAMFDFGFVRYDTWESGIDYEAGIFESTSGSDITLTDEGIGVLDELEKILSANY